MRLVKHSEPIVLIGIPEAKVLAALNGLIGTDLAPVASGAAKPPQAEIVSGATVTVLVMGDSIVRSAVKLIRSGRLGGVDPATVAPEVQRLVICVAQYYANDLWSAMTRSARSASVASSRA